VRVGSLFTGIGGLDLGLERAGMEIAWQCEIDPYCQQVLRKHWPEVKLYGDIRTVVDPEPVDLICGGFPCQPHSLAGKRLASADERDLWGEYLRLIGDIKPRWVLAENVPGLLSSETGRFFGGVLRDLAEAGYDAEWASVPAASVGAPHIRDRVWILAYPRCEPGSERKPRFGRRDYVFPQGTRGEAQERGADRELVALVPGVHPGTPADWWAAQSRVARSANGLPNQLDRLKALGNAVVPAVAEALGRLIMEADAAFWGTRVPQNEEGEQ
jgi:DNA (cytosine-5)-methyltransferase 1